MTVVAVASALATVADAACTAASGKNDVMRIVRAISQWIVHRGGDKTKRLIVYSLLFSKWRTAFVKRTVATLLASPITIIEKTAAPCWQLL
jgi:hypothetical protein